MTGYYITFDTETGGLDPSKHALLTASFSILDKSLNVIANLDLRVQPNAGYEIASSAIAVNGIDIDSHIAMADYSSIAANKLMTFLKVHTYRGQRLIPVGHNYKFDEAFITEHLVPQHQWLEYVHYRGLDTAIIAEYLKLKGKLPEGTGGSLSSLCAFYGIPVQGAHNARADVEMTIKLLKEMIWGKKG